MAEPDINAFLTDLALLFFHPQSGNRKASHPPYRLPFLRDTHFPEDGHLFAVSACASPHADGPSTAQAGIWTVQERLGHKDVSTTMIYTHVLNRGPAAVRSPADRFLTSSVPPKGIDCTILQPSSAALMPPAMARAKYIQPVPAHPQNPGEGNRLQHLAALKEIDTSV